jgi:hypothetical protein
MQAAQEQLEKSGALTAAEIEAEKTRVAESKLAEAGKLVTLHRCLYARTRVCMYVCVCMSASIHVSTAAVQEAQGRQLLKARAESQQ